MTASATGRRRSGTPRAAPSSEPAARSLQRRLQPRRGARGDRERRQRGSRTRRAAPARTLRGHRDTLWSAAFSPDGERVVTASNDGTARIWDAGAAPSSRACGRSDPQERRLQPQRQAGRHRERRRDGADLGRGERRTSSRPSRPRRLGLERRLQPRRRARRHRRRRRHGADLGRGEGRRASRPCSGHGEVRLRAPTSAPTASWS